MSGAKNLSVLRAEQKRTFKTAIDARKHKQFCILSFGNAKEVEGFQFRFCALKLSRNLDRRATMG